jgi:hypothetical protein
LSIVTLPGKEVDRALVASVRTKLRNAYPNLRMKTFTSRSFHDRFWVNAKGRKAFVSGTSLNGLGRKYALLASLSDADTLDVIAALRDEQVI